MMTRQEIILNYVSMAGTDLSQKVLSRRKAINKVYYLCKENRVKVTKKVITDLINLEIKALWLLKSDNPESSCKIYKEQKDYFFYNEKA